MRKLLASVAALGLTACNPAVQTNIDTINAQIAADLPTACALASTADASFQTVAATGKLSANVVSNEAAAMAGVKSICANPSSVSAATALQTVANAYAAVVAQVVASKMR